MVALQLNSPQNDLSDLFFAPKEGGVPQAYFLESKNSSASNSNINYEEHYVGPIHVASTGVAHGLGVIASRDIEAGECLFVIRPAVSAKVSAVFEAWKSNHGGELNEDHPTTQNGSQDEIDNANTGQTSLEQIAEEVLVKAMRENMVSDEEDCRSISQSFLLQLSLGDEKDARSMPVPKSQSALLQALVGKSENLSDDSSLKNETDNKLLEIIRRNAFGPDFTSYESVEKQWKEHLLEILQQRDQVPTSPSRLLGLYPLAAMINHSCVPNAVRVFAGGEWMVVHASAKIPKDSEVVWSYLPAILSYPQRKQQLEVRHGFTCHCVRCENEAQAAATNDLFSLPSSLQAFEKTPGPSPAPENGRAQFTKDLMDWEQQLFSGAALSNETRRYWKMGNANLYIQYLNAVLMDLPNHSPQEIEEQRATLLAAAMELHFCFVACHYASTEHLSVMHLCYDLVSVMHSQSTDPSKTLPKVRFWTEQLKRAHMIRYGSLGKQLDKVRAIMKHTQLVLRNQNGLEKVPYDFI